MGMYFDDQESMHAKHGGNMAEILTVIANRYLGENPPQPVTYRGYCKNGIRRVSNYRYHFNLEERFPQARPEEIVYAWAKLWSAQEAEINLVITGSGPVSLFLNGQLVFKTNIVNERFRDDKNPVKVKLNQGWNNFLLKFIKTPKGFGGFVGTFSPKSMPLHFLMPSREREGQEGWLFTAPLMKELPELPGLDISESETGVMWFPQREWSAPELQMGQLRRMYGLVRGWTAAGWAQGNFRQTGPGKYTLQGWNRGSIRVYVDDAEMYHSSTSGEFQQTIEIPGGQREVMVVSGCGEMDWGFEIHFLDGDEPIRLSSPRPIHGAVDPWFYLGPFSGEEGLPERNEIRRMDRLFSTAPGFGYWRLDLPDVWVRPYLENRNFGNWNYPLGVVLYGLLQTGRLLDSDIIIDYVQEHVELSLSFFDYAGWDKEQYGAAGIHHLLTNINCLDDCGSFGSLMLELARTSRVRGYREVADFIAGYIHEKQERLPDGAFFRPEAPNTLIGTLWVDDLYMSVPFLCRYYLLSGDLRFLDDAVRQLRLFYQYLYLPDRRILSHVFDVKLKKATGVPWGRGNGWAAFSFSEALAVLPENHPDRPALMEYFNNLCEGYLALQDEAGMWHQVLTDHESYPEASCTSMFVYAFARGVRYGWLLNPKPYRRAALKAWEGLMRICVDHRGNIYGVCRGSGYSFTADYYKNDLSWNLNDTHGTGIVLLAGVEVLKMVESSQT